MSRRHLINSSDVFVIKGFTVENAKISRKNKSKISRNDNATILQKKRKLWKKRKFREKYRIFKNKCKIVAKGRENSAKKTKFCEYKTHF